MGFVNGLVLILLGALCKPSLVEQKIPKAKKLLDKVVSFQHIIGGAAIVWGVALVLVSPIMSLFNTFLNPNFSYTSVIINVITNIVNGILFLLAGLCFVWGWIKICSFQSVDRRRKSENRSVICSYFIKIARARSERRIGSNR